MPFKLIPIDLSYFNLFFLKGGSNKGKFYSVINSDNIDVI